MKVLLLIGVLLLAFQSDFKDEIKLEIGANLPDKYVKQKIEINGKDMDVMIATSPSQMRPFIGHKINSVAYLIAFDEKSRKSDTFIRATRNSEQKKD